MEFCRSCGKLQRIAGTSWNLQKTLETLTTFDKNQGHLAVMSLGSRAESPGSQRSTAMSGRGCRLEMRRRHGLRLHLEASAAPPALLEAVNQFFLIFMKLIKRLSSIVFCKFKFRKFQQFSAISRNSGKIPWICGEKCFICAKLRFAFWNLSNELNEILQNNVTSAFERFKGLIIL